MPNDKSDHQQAMDLAERALVLESRDGRESAQVLFGEAFNYEKAAAMRLREGSAEPSRSVLFRSAASLALRAGLVRDAEQMICYGLVGDPPRSIAEELRDLMEQVYFARHLELRGIVLRDNEIQLSLAGREIGHGMVRSEEFVTRFRLLETLSYRTAERLSGQPFRGHGQVPKVFRANYEPYMSVPRAASFAVTIRFGMSVRNFELFPEYSIDSPAVIEDMVTNLELVNDKREQDLQNSIPEPEYYENFLYLAKKLSPDKDSVSLVGITSNRKGQTKTTALTRLKKDIRVIHKSDDEQYEQKGEDVEITGRLTFAKAPTRGDQGRVQLTTEGGDIYRIVVPHSVMNDIVKPYWEEIVTIAGRRIDNKVYFEDIQAD